MDVAIRKMEESDYSAVTELLVRDLWDNHFSGENVVPFFNRVKDNDCYVTFVALVDGVVIGAICAFEMFWATTDTLFIQAFVVGSEYQNKSVGTKLLGHTEQYAKSRGLAGVGLQSGVQRTSAHAFYERNGYTKSNYFYKNF